MSRARREEIENPATRKDYLDRLAKSHSILPPDATFIAEQEADEYGIPWLYSNDGKKVGTSFLRSNLLAFCMCKAVMNLAKQ